MLLNSIIFDASTVLHKGTFLYSCGKLPPIPVEKRAHKRALNVKFRTGHGFNEHLYGHNDTLGDDERCLVKLVPVCLVTPISFYLMLMGFSLLQKIWG